MKKSLKEKSLNYVKQFPDEFILAPNDKIYCNICNIVVSSERKSLVDDHRKSKKHIKNTAKIPENEIVSEQTFLVEKNDNKLLELITNAFLSTNTPLHRLNSYDFKALFKYLLCKPPSVSQIRSYILNDRKKDQEATLTQYFEDKKFFIIIDESEIQNNKYVNIIGGIIEKPEKNYLLDTIQLEFGNNMNSKFLCEILIHCFDKYSMNKKNLRLIMSDAASYMIKGCIELKKTIPDFFHVTCFAHLLHNCAMNVRAHYNEINNLIASVKAITVKNKTTSNLFTSIGKPPNVIVTRWSSWLKAALYYADNLPQIKLIVNQISYDGKLIERAKLAIMNNQIVQDLIEIKENYAVLISLLDTFEDNLQTIQSGYNAIKEIKIKNDTVGIKEYLKMRLDKNEAKDLLNFSNDNVSPTEYALLKNCNPTSISVERSFSMLGKFLTKDRNFKPKNIYSYFSLYYNKGGKEIIEIDEVEEI